MSCQYITFSSGCSEEGSENETRCVCGGGGGGRIGGRKGEGRGERESSSVLRRM